MYVSRDPFGGVRPRSLDEALAIIERLLATIASSRSGSPGWKRGSWSNE